MNESVVRREEESLYKLVAMAVGTIIMAVAMFFKNLFRV